MIEVDVLVAFLKETSVMPDPILTTALPREVFLLTVLSLGATVMLATK